MEKIIDNCEKTEIAKEDQNATSIVLPISFFDKAIIFFIRDLLLEF